MASTKTLLQSQTWTRPNYLITTCPSHLSIADVNEAFASKEMYWANPLPENAMYDLLSSSLCYGVFCISDMISTGTPSTEKSTFQLHPSTSATPSIALPENAKLIGIGRIMTDFTTMAYLTDIFISSSHQGRGLGRWMLTCMQESLGKMPYLRGSMLFTGDRRSVMLYEEVLGMSVNGYVYEKEEGGKVEGLVSMLRTWEGSPLFGKGH